MNDVIRFWFEEIDSSMWFKKDDSFDEQIRRRFLDVYEKAFAGQTSSWRTTAEGRLAEIIVLDQFGRNMFRGTPASFAGDEKALILSRDAVARGIDQELAIEKRGFMYMPYMHSESVAAHEEAIKLFSQRGLESNLRFEVLHKKIIDQFGRYPHRNQILNRPSTPAELEFLEQANSSF